MKEKRKFIRLRAPIGVRYKRIRKHRRSRESTALTKDISGGGICILVKEELRVGDLLKLELYIPLLEEPVRATGEVAWFSEFEAGIRFRDIAPAELHSVLEFVHTVGIG